MKHAAGNTARQFRLGVAERGLRAVPLAAGAAWVLSQGHAKNKESFATDGGIAPLVALLANGNGRAQARARNSTLTSTAYDLCSSWEHGRDGGCALPCAKHAMRCDV